jgi:transposase
MSKKRIRNYSLEFKQSSAELARSSDQSISQTAKDLGINENTLHGWIKKYTGKSKMTLTATSRNSLEEEVKQLRKENARLKQDREILKKAAVSSTGRCNTKSFKMKMRGEINDTIGKTGIIGNRQSRIMATMEIRSIAQ